MTDFPRQLRIFTLAVIAAALAAVALPSARAEFPPLLPLALFAALVVFSEQRRVVLPNSVSVSPSFMVGMAAVIVFDHESAIAGSVIVGIAGGLYLPHVRRGRWQWVVFNGGCLGLALLAAGLAYAAIPRHADAVMPAALAIAFVPALAYVTVDCTLVALSLVVERRENMLTVLRGMVPLALQSFPFAIVGCFIGRLYVQHGSLTVLLLVSPILIAREVFAAYVGIHEAHEASLAMLLKVLHAKDEYTAGHAERVARYAQYMGEELGFTPARLERLRYAALMHDIGKLVVPNHLLNKPASLTPEEYARVRAHEPTSVEMLSRIEFLAPIAHAVDSDQARFEHDETLPIEPYIIAVADAYDAMTSTRAYRLALTQEVAFKELTDNAGRQFHPYCVAALLHAVQVRGERHGLGHEAEPVKYAVPPPEAGVGSAGLGDLLSSGGVA